MSQQKMSRGDLPSNPVRSCWDPCNLGSSLVLFLAANYGMTKAWGVDPAHTSHKPASVYVYRPEAVPAGSRPLPPSQPPPVRPSCPDTHNNINSCSEGPGRPPMGMEICPALSGLQAAASRRGEVDTHLRQG